MAAIRITPHHRPRVGGGHWEVPVHAWQDEPVFIVGGGKSLTGFDFDRLRIPGVRVMAINSAFKVVPWADMLFFADRRWHDWNRDALPLFQGTIVTRTTVRDAVPNVTIHRLNRDSNSPLSRRADHIGGWCSGGCGINLTYLLGGNPIYLFGFDMIEGNWHDWHKLPPKEGQHKASFIPPLERMAPELVKDGTRVINTNLNSALRCFPFLPLDEVLAMSSEELVRQKGVPDTTT